MTLDPIKLPLHIINLLIMRFSYTTYLELGVRWKKENFDRVECKLKHGVDIQDRYSPTFLMSADEFFRTVGKDNKYDLIYVDDDHRELPALRSMANAIDHLNPGGTVVVDNLLPVNEHETRVTASADAWKAWAYFRMSRPDLWMVAINMYFGCGIIRRGHQELFIPDELPYKPMKKDPPVDFAFYAKYRSKLMNVITVDEFVRETERMT